ncbi:hypothetical protein O3G_MSEX001083 [Manduca sexta]|nr:hypothetical protein O3G_MSEX001083 [Manduca sexta]
MSQMCRACLTTKETFSYFLFENVSAEDFCFCTSIEVQENEDLPKTLCNPCYELLMKYTEFKKTCIESQNTLHSLKNDFKHEPGDSNLYCENIFLNDEKKNIAIDVYSGIKLEDESDHLADGKNY